MPKQNLKLSKMYFGLKLPAKISARHLCPAFCFNRHMADKIKLKSIIYFPKIVIVPKLWKDKRYLNSWSISCTYRCEYDNFFLKFQLLSLFRLNFLQNWVWKCFKILIGVVSSNAFAEKVQSLPKPLEHRSGECGESRALRNKRNYPGSNVCKRRRLPWPRSDLRRGSLRRLWRWGGDTWCATRTPWLRRSCSRTSFRLSDANLAWSRTRSPWE